MGPRFFKRGETKFRICDRDAQSASMGPRFFKRGEIIFRDRAQVVVLLQWGHASSSVERARLVSAVNVPGSASMGPRFFKRGEWPNPPAVPEP